MRLRISAVALGLVAGETRSLNHGSVLGWRHNIGMRLNGWFVLRGETDVTGNL